MKLFTLISAALFAGVAVAPATAQMHDRHETHVTQRTEVRTDRHQGWNDRHHARQRCRTEWRHHHRVRICRNVRW